MNKEVLSDAFLEFLSYFKEVLDTEDTDLTSIYSRGRASGMHSVLLCLDTAILSFDIDRNEIGFDGLSAEEWFEK